MPVASNDRLRAGHRPPFAQMQALPDIAPFQRRLHELDSRMAEPDFFADSRRAAEVTREHQKLQRLVEKYRRFQELSARIEENRELAADPTDPEMRDLAESEIPALEAERSKLKQEILVEMLPPDPNDSRNIIVEIRAGAGGDEASLFAGDLYRMYQRFADRHGWKVETLGASVNEAGGYKEVSFSLNGEDAYKTLKYESGVHRVQRIPSTEASGRIHTSTATVAVLPEAEEVDIQIDPEELEITISRASGPGGQGVNTTDSAVQILHKPTGLIVACADERSQLKNKQKAMTVLRARLLKRREEEERARYAAERKGQIGTGDRSERIRTYNFPQSRVTDHRIGLTIHSLEEMMTGEIEPVVHALREADQQRRLEALNLDDAISCG